MLDELVKFFVVLLVVVEPLSLLPILAGLTEGADDAFRRRMSFKAAAISAVVCVLFAVGGTAVLVGMTPLGERAAFDVYPFVDGSRRILRAVSRSAT